jgi:hypothetical protein
MINTLKGVSSKTSIAGAIWARQVAANPHAEVAAIWARIEAALAIEPTSLG